MHLSIHPHPFLVCIKIFGYNTAMSKRSLEQYQIFPYIAWTLVGGFAFFVYTLTSELSSATAELEATTNQLEAKANQDPASITNFDR